MLTTHAGIGVYGALQKILFALSHHRAHALAMGGLAPLESLPSLRRAVGRYTTRSLEVSAMGLRFPNPIGIAGGFDKNATRARALVALGFGFLELGTVTAEAQAANPAPNLFRLVEDRALVNRLGFPNEGAERVCAKIAIAKPDLGVPCGVSIGKSRSVPADDIDRVVSDYLTSFGHARRVADFVVVNVSSPNTANLRALQGASHTRALLSALLRENPDRVPLLIKVAPDLDDGAYGELLDVVAELEIAGVVATNTTLSRAGLRTPASVVEAIGAGGLSGPPLRPRALAMVAAARRRLGANSTVIGVGGIERGEDARAFLDAGASLVQVYTGFVYGGPLTARKLTDYLVRHPSSTQNDAATA